MSEERIEKSEKIVTGNIPDSSRDNMKQITQIDKK
jgi:hypothetical protein